MHRQECPTLYSHLCILAPYDPGPLARPAGLHGGSSIPTPTHPSRGGILLSRPSRVCAVPGCPEFTPCPKHGAETTEDRPGSAARGYGARWKAYSEAYRRKHPLCRPCQAQNRETPTDAVDHIQPVTGPTDPRFWARDNHQPICRSCHAIKTAQEGRTQGTKPILPANPRRWVIA